MFLLSMGCKGSKTIEVIKSSQLIHEAPNENKEINILPYNQNVLSGDLLKDDEDDIPEKKKPPKIENFK